MAVQQATGNSVTHVDWRSTAPDIASDIVSDVASVATGAVNRDRFATVAIPDLRTQSISSTEPRPKYRFDGAHKALFSEALPTMAIPSEQELATDTADAIPAATTPDVKLTTSTPSTATSNLEQIRRSIESHSGIAPVAELQSREEQNREEQIQEEHVRREISAPTPATTNHVETKQSDCYLERLEIDTEQIAPLVDSMIERNPKGNFAIFGIACSENNPHASPTIAATAKMLHEKTGDRVLLIDADFENGELTTIFQKDRAKGMADLARKHIDLAQVIQETSNEQVDFLGTGKDKIVNERKLHELVQNMVPKLADLYQYVLVNMGNAHERSARIWANYNSGSYLVVSMRNTNQHVAKSAVSQLHTYGARLIGCIVSDHSDNASTEDN